MGRSNKAPAGEGHNRPPLTPDEIEALGVHHQLAISGAQRKLDAILAEAAGLRKVVNGNFKRMTADLGYTRDDFQREVLNKLNMTEAEYQAYVVRVDQLHRIAGLKQGEQIDLIEHVLKDTVDESEAAFQDGFRAGRRADEPTPPTHVAGILHPKWMEGYHAGQAYNGMQLAKAADVLAKRGQPNADDDTPDLNAGGDEPDDEADLDEAARALKRSGFMETSGEGGEQPETFETPAEELAAQKPRRAVREAKAGKPEQAAA